MTSLALSQGTFTKLTLTWLVPSDSGELYKATHVLGPSH